MKKVVCVFLTFTCILLMNSTAFALELEGKSIDFTQPSKIEYEDVLEKASGILEAAKFSGDYKQLNDENKYYLGSEIPVYNLNNDSIVIADFKYYPVFSGNEVIGVIIARIANNDEIVLEYIDIFAKELNEIYQMKEAVCILFTEDYAVVYSQNNFKKLYVENKNNTSPKSSKFNAYTIKDSLNKKHIKKLDQIDNNPILTAYAVSTGSKKLSVPRKLQTKGSSYCWACAASSVGQFKKPSIVLDPKDIAYEYAGNLTTAKTISTVKKVLSEKYKINSSLRNLSLKMSDVQENIKANNPIATYVRYTLTTGHFIVVRGYYVSSVSSSGTYYAYIMDPAYGAGYRTMEVSANAVDREIKYYGISDGKEYNTTMYLEL